MGVLLQLPPTVLNHIAGEAHGFKGSFANKETLNGFYCFFCRVLGIQPSVKSQVTLAELLFFLLF